MIDLTVEELEAKLVDILKRSGAIKDCEEKDDG